MNAAPRITLEDDLIGVTTKLAEGNPGALRVLLEILQDGQAIDPYGAPFLAVLLFDTFGIYGCRIWMLYKDVCKQSVSRTIALIRSVQLGLLDEATLHSAIDNYGAGLDVAAVLAKVQERLPDFKFDNAYRFLGQ